MLPGYRPARRQLVQKALYSSPLSTQIAAGARRLTGSHWYATHLRFTPTASLPGARVGLPAYDVARILLRQAPTPVQGSGWSSGPAVCSGRCPILAAQNGIFSSPSQKRDRCYCRCHQCARASEALSPCRARQQRSTNNQNALATGFQVIFSSAVSSTTLLPRGTICL